MTYLEMEIHIENFVSVECVFLLNSHSIALIFACDVQFENHINLNLLGKHSMYSFFIFANAVHIS